MLSCGIRAIAPVVNAHTVIKTLHDVVEIGDIARILKAQNLPTAIHDNFAGAADVKRASRSQRKIPVANTN